MAYELKENERLTPVMIYAPMRLTWGKLVHPETIRPQVWLKNSIIPEYLVALETETLIFGGGQPARISIPEQYIPVPQITAMHLLPPAEFELDYDPSEPNRTMNDVAITFDIFRLDGQVRIASFADFLTSVRSYREAFRSFYSVTISHPATPALKPLAVPHILVRTNAIHYLIEK